jgi:hypothetical protein
MQNTIFYAGTPALLPARSASLSGSPFAIGFASSGRWSGRVLYRRERDRLALERCSLRLCSAQRMCSSSLLSCSSKLRRTASFCSAAARHIATGRRSGGWVARSCAAARAISRSMGSTRIPAAARNGSMTASAESVLEGAVEDLRVDACAHDEFVACGEVLSEEGLGASVVGVRRVQERDQEICVKDYACHSSRSWSRWPAG